ncbi:hypothetical protein EEB14_18720 [Rhodococcus sp. WS4]|nr:hypothetical protein EEB14_18720 [Rhodococcus sp. WS4]
MDSLVAAAVAQLCDLASESGSIGAPGMEVFVEVWLELAEQLARDSVLVSGSSTLGAGEPPYRPAVE